MENYRDLWLRAPDADAMYLYEWTSSGHALRILSVPTEEWIAWHDASYPVGDCVQDCFCELECWDLDCGPTIPHL